MNTYKKMGGGGVLLLPNLDGLRSALPPLALPVWLCEHGI